MLTEMRIEGLGVIDEATLDLLGRAEEPIGTGLYASTADGQNTVAVAPS